MSSQQPTTEKSMEEILASIRKTIESDIQENHQGDQMSEKNPSHHEDGDVFELTQMVNDDGSVSDYASTTSDSDTELTAQDADETSRDTTSETTKHETQHVEETPDTQLSSFQVTLEESVPQEISASSASEDSQESSSQSSEEALGQLIETPLPSDKPDNTAAQTQTGEHDMTDFSNASSQATKESHGSENLISETVAQAASQAFSDLVTAVETTSASATENNTSSANSATNNIGQSTVEDLIKDLLRPMLKDWIDSNLPSLVKWIVTEQIEKVVQEKKKS